MRSMSSTSRISAPIDVHALRTLCLDLLGRPALRAEHARWSTLERGALIDELLAGHEHWQHWYEEQLYYFLLINNVRPESERLAAIPADLEKKRLDVREALHRIALSASFDQRNPGADTFVTVVLEQVAGLEVKKSVRDLEVGKKIYDGAEGSFLGASGRTQADIVRIAIESHTASQHFLRREHERLLHARPEPKDLSTWSASFERDPSSYPALVRAWLMSAAYDARLARPVLLENRKFAKALFVDLADRIPAFEEADPLREALDALADSAPLRAVTARLLLDSGKAKLPSKTELADSGAWARGLIARLLGRLPRAGEVEAFAAVLAEPEARPETVLYAMVSSPEYSRY